MLVILLLLLKLLDIVILYKFYYFTNTFHHVGNLRVRSNKTDFQNTFIDTMSTTYFFPHILFITPEKYELHV